jgi:hypothetical protein
MPLAQPLQCMLVTLNQLVWLAVAGGAAPIRHSESDATNKEGRVFMGKMKVAKAVRAGGVGSTNRVLRPGER